MLADPRLTEIIYQHKRSGTRGIHSICSANPYVLTAAMQRAARLGDTILIEATCNQVNQFGGYTGLTPAEFRDQVWTMAADCGLSRQHIILGGDHLGPTPWQRESSASAMSKAREMMALFAQAGYSKLHLDASVRLGDDDPNAPLPLEVAADRAAQLCAVAEAAWPQDLPYLPCYIVGTEVPTPGGAQEHEESLQVSLTANVEQMLQVSQAAFLAHGLETAWDRVIGVVVQPGVEFGDDQIFDYQRDAAKDLSRYIEQYPHLVYEAHSTDYQTPAALRALVEDHFAILKVGPALTFAFREAVFALAHIEWAWLGAQRDQHNRSLSHLETVLDQAMLDKPQYWQAHYHGTPEAVAFARRYSLSDRVRYYWGAESVVQALQLLIHNLEQNPPPYSLLSQFMPAQYARIREGDLPNQPLALLYAYIEQVLAVYEAACGLERR